MDSTVKKCTCVDCGISAPETNTAHTLISQQHGWRLARKALPNGSWAIEWRCPKCWKIYKGRVEP